MSNRLRSLILPLGIALLAFFLRTVALDVAPPGVTHDEAAHMHDAERIWEGWRPIYLSTAYGREPLYDYVNAPLIGVAGKSIVIGRFSSALWGTALVALLYVWTVRAFDRPTAAAAAGMMAVSFWPLSTSREILRSITMPTVFTAALVFFWSAVYPHDGRHRRSRFVIAGLLLGLGFYTYMPARFAWLAPALLGLSLAATDRPRWRRVRMDLLVMLLVMAAVAAPLLGYLATNPELEVRVDELAAPLRSLLEGDPGPLWARFRETVLLFSHRGDVQWIYNISGRPLLPPVVAILFYLGLLAALVRSFDKLHTNMRLLLIWLVVGVTPALITGLESSALRAIGAQPAVFVLAAWPLAAAARRVGSLANPRARRTWAAGVLVAFGLLALYSAQVYFRDWATNRDTRVAYHNHLIEMAGYLASHPDDAPAGVSSIYPGPLHDPYAADLVLDRTGIKETLRWYDARRALVFPGADRARALFPALAPLDPALQPYFSPTARLLDRIDLMPTDLSPWFEVYVWNPNSARAALPLGEFMSVGHLIDMAGFEMLTPESEPGGVVEVITFWAPRQTGGIDDELVLFIHLLDGAEVVAQDDRLDFPPSSWRDGDLFAQLYRFSLPARPSSSQAADLAPVEYGLEIGAYLRAPGYPRLRVYRGGEDIGDRITLPPVIVALPDG